MFMYSGEANVHKNAILTTAFIEFSVRIPFEKYQQQQLTIIHEIIFF